MEIIIDEKIFKAYNDNYFVSENGDVYSTYSRKILKHNIDNDGYHRVDINRKHVKIHRLVYITWVGEIKDGEQINHRDDDKDNNHYTNLYKGDQKQNIQDCINNNHRVGNVWYLTIYDRKEEKTISFSPASDFIKYSGHKCENGSVKRMFTRNWFRKRYEIIDYKKKSVTTKDDECNPVRRNLSPFEARRTYKCEDIV